MNKAKYMLIIPEWDDDSGYDHRPDPRWAKPDLYYLEDSDLKDLESLMNKYNIRSWAPEGSDPLDFESWASKDWKKRIASLVQIRSVNIIPTKVVKSWGISHIETL